MAKIKNFLKEIQVSLNFILSEIFEILGVDYQMSTTCGQDKLHRSYKKAYFSCVISIYFLSFFYDHPVWFGLRQHLSKATHGLLILFLRFGRETRIPLFPRDCFGIVHAGNDILKIFDRANFDFL